MAFVFVIVVFFIDHYCAGVSNKHCLSFFSTARSNFVPYAFVWEKVKTVDFSETIVVYE